MLDDDGQENEPAHHRVPETERCADFRSALSKAIGTGVGRLLIAAVVISWIFAIICGVSEIFDYFYKDALPAIPPFLHSLGGATPLAFIVSLSASALLIFERFVEFRAEAMDHLQRYKTELENFRTDNHHRMERLKEQMVSEFARQTASKVRFVEVGEDYQIGALYHDAVSIQGYFPVHTILRDNKHIRVRLIDRILKEDFSKYRMILGKNGTERMTEIAKQIVDEAPNYQRAKLQRILKTKFLCRVTDETFDECTQVKMSFFVVQTLSDEEPRAVIYFWIDPFGSSFDTVRSALVIEGGIHVTYLSRLFLDKWGELGETRERDFFSEPGKVKSISNPGQGADAAVQ